jgi:(1->4)-alpha-D-glucan 1-alpha-D-glucosylmutase
VSEAFDRLCGLLGVASSYVDAYGRPAETSPEGRRAILRDFGYPADTDDMLAASLDRAERLRAGLAPMLVVVVPGKPTRMALRAPAGAVARWTLTDEAGRVREGFGALRAADSSAGLELPRLDAGYHRLELDCGGARANATVIVAPERCFLPPELRGDVRAWGLAAQVYGLRSDAGAGIGSYCDLARLADGAGALGATFLGLSPVHALFAGDRGKISPYSPSSRLALETVHIDPTRAAGFAGSEAARLWRDAEPRLAELRAADLIDHRAVWAALSPVLEALFAARSSETERELAAFRRERPATEAHAVFEGLDEHLRGLGHAWPGDWPEGLRRRSSPEVAAFARDHGERVAFHAFLQFLADGQLAAAHAAAKRAGMAVGLYRDLAVGADRGGSEVWSAPDRFGPSLSIGAPPDVLAPQGQDWGLPPLDPFALEANGLDAFRALVQANMRHAGALRIDHAFQLRRLYLIPVGGRAADGAYVEYPFEAMLAVLRLESWRARSLVIAEDLGTAPPGFSDALSASGVLGYRVLPFERDGAAFKPPERYTREAVAVTSTHDLPTFVGWWRGLDTDLRQTLGLYDRERAEAERAERARDRAELIEALHAAGLDPPADDEPPTEDMLRFLARSASLLQGVQLEDVVGELNQANLPGTVEGHPNWRRRLALGLDEVLAPGGPLAKTAALLAAEGRALRPGASRLAAPPPRATYRVQLNKDFTFYDAAAIAPYLAKLGVSHLYASPIHRARPGSTHGYDIADHREINPELGGEDGFARLSETLKANGLGLVLDIVPNHMGVGGSDNPWWLSVLEWGPLSPWARAFDIDWERIGAEGKLVVPFLADRYGEALEKGALELRFDPATGAFDVWHHEHRFPVSPLAYPLVLDRALAALGDVAGVAASSVIAASERLRVMAAESAPDRVAGFPEEAERLKRVIADAAAADADLAGGIERAVQLVNGRPGFPESFGTLHRILEMQSYRLAHWRVAASDINFRRFFDINALAGLRVEDPDVFAHAHERVFALVRDGQVHGLRVDHVDGLADPEGYLRALQRAVGPGFYVLVEKILEPGERLRPWPIAGTTGYEALALIDGLFVERAAEPAFDAVVAEVAGAAPRFAARLEAAKAEVLETSFASELEVLVSDLKRIAQPDRRTRDFTAVALRRALVEIVARFPVYRSYLREDEAADPADRELVEGSVRRAQRDSALPDRSVHDFIADVVLGRIETDAPGRPDPDLPRRFRRRFQQLTGPVMAKSLEDTLFYRDVRLLALNEVGGDPHRFGVSQADFHADMAERARLWPAAMTASATHDTKRGEDARGRLLALTEIPERWAQAARRFEAIARPLLGTADDGEAPDANDRLLLLQSLLAAWPDALIADPRDEPAAEAFRERASGFLQKAMREAKRHTSWVNVDEAYEGEAQRVLRAVLEPGGGFLSGFAPLAATLARAGRLVGLARTVLKCTVPGVPDIYQGTEFWDLAFVDPDNRRPVDFEARTRALDDARPLSTLAETGDPALKARVLASLLADRAAHPAFYAEAEHRPAATAGARAANIVAFTRRRGADSLLVAVPRAVLVGLAETRTPSETFWAGASVAAEEGVWRNVLTGDRLTSSGALPAAALFAALPAAVLRRETTG